MSRAQARGETGSCYSPQILHSYPSVRGQHSHVRSPSTALVTRAVQLLRWNVCFAWLGSRQLNTCMHGTRAQNEKGIRVCVCERDMERRVSVCEEAPGFALAPVGSTSVYYVGKCKLCGQRQYDSKRLRVYRVLER